MTRHGHIMNENGINVETDKTKKTLRYIGLYTIVFFAAAFLSFSPFILEGKTWIWSVSDGRAAYTPFVAYCGRLFRRVIIGLLHGDFSFPMYDISLGMGADIIGHLNAGGFNDPLMLLSTFVLTDYMEYLYAFLIILRLYLVGLSFSYLCFYFKRDARYALIGSIVYCCSGYALFCSMRHPLFFITCMIQLPLLIVGTEMILKREKPYVLIFTVFYAALCEYYHLYMMTIMIVVYAIVRFFDLYETNRLKEFFCALWRGIQGYVLGLGLSAIVLFPTLVTFFNAARAGFSNYNPVSYNWSYFRTRILYLIAPSTGGQWTYPMLAAIVLLALVLLFFSKNKRTLKMLVVVALATWLTDIGGLIMNGFQYSSHRWTFGLALLLAFVVVDMLPTLLAMSAKQRIISFGLLLAYATILFWNKSSRKGPYGLLGLCFLALTTLCLTASMGDLNERKPDLAARAKPARDYRYLVCLLLVVANVGINGIYRFASDQANYIADFAKWGDEVRYLVESAEKDLTHLLSSKPEGRGDSSSFARNVAMAWQIPGMIPYTSVVSGDIVEFQDQIEWSTRYQSYHTFSSDQRTIVNTLLSTKYHIEDKTRTAYVPYGYTQIEETESGRIIYENEFALPWGYTYDNVMSYDELDGLNGLQKQEAMLQAIALSDVNWGESESKELIFDEQTVPFELNYENCSWEDGKLTVSKANATITLSFALPAFTEGYLRLQKLDINNSGQSDFRVQIQCGSIAKRSLVTSRLYTWYTGRENYLFNLGYSEEERGSLTITFPVKGTFELEDIQLYALPMDDYSARVEALREEPLKNIEWDTNRLSGTVDLSREKVLCVSIPYGPGWSAKVDGKETKILKGNYMFMAIPLEAGHHEVEFSYCSPGIKLGMIVALLSAGIVVWMLIRDRRKAVRDAQIDAVRNAL